MIYRSSQIKLAKQCPTKAYFKYSLGIVPKGRGKKNPDLFFGTVVHKALEILLLEGQEKSVEYLDVLEFPPGSKTQAIAKILVNLFRMKFKDEVVACERYFQLDIDGISLLGKYDLIAKSEGGVYVGDYKTTTPYYLLFKPDDQFISYFIAARSEFNAKHVVIYNLDPGSVDISMSLITYTDAEIEEWKRETKSFISYFQSCVDSGVVPKNPGACLDFGRRCEYHELCTSSPKVRQALIDGAFAVDKESLNLMW